LKIDIYQISIIEMASCKNSKAKEEKMKRWLDRGGVMIIGMKCIGD
jgi:hypothetical protein